MKNVNLQGICVPLLTPYDENGRIDYSRLEKIMNYISDNGVNKFFVGGTTGEFANLTMEERINLIRNAVQFAKPDWVLMNNVTANNLADLAKLIDVSMEMGVDFVSLTPPYYHLYDEKALNDFFVAASKIEPSVKIYLYNIPSMAKNVISPRLLSSLRISCPNIVGIKDSSMDFMTILEYQAQLDDDFEILTGNDAQILTALQASADGAVIASANVWPKVCADIYAAYMGGDITKATKLQKFIMNFRSLCRKIMPIGAHKEALRMMGVDPGSIRLPMRRLTDSEKVEIHRFLEHANALMNQ